MNGFEDWVRLLISLLSLISIVILVNRFRKNQSGYNSKTRDLWYALVSWCAVGVIGPLARAIWETSGPGLTMSVVAVAVTLKGVLPKGTWGTTDA